MKKFLFYIVLVAIPTGGVLAQSMEDVLRFSQPTYLGSTRFMASGGAFTSLGNDFTAAHQNPAGLAVYRRTEIGLSMGALNASSTSSFQNLTLNDDAGGFLFGNVGLVIALPEERDWAWNIGLSFNRSADYKNRLTARGKTANISRINMWIDNAQGVHPDQMLDAGLAHEWLAFQGYLIDPDSDNNYTTQADIEIVDNVYTVDQKGGMNELGFIFAAEKDNRWYFGGSLNIPIVSFTRNVVYQERYALGDSIASFDLKEYNKISGAGINLKFGLQYRFDNGFRMGAAIHTPSWMTLEQEWEDEIFTRFKNGGALSEVISVYSDPYQWNLNTPWRGLLGISKVFGKNGFISVDYELNALSTARAKSDSISVEYLDEEIKEFTRLSHIIRAGAELRIQKFYLRGGYVFETSGLNSTFETANTNTLSVGAGYRGKDVTIEFAYAIRNRSQNYYFYNPEYAPAVSTDLTQKPLMFSLAYRIGNR
ncbi:MAG: hypothetical protein N4A46_01055 [Schleiferiaceae bacterium]|nr:hypothetical protein [Schleiferiaceae bacterium]